MHISIWLSFLIFREEVLFLRIATAFWNHRPAGGFHAIRFFETDGYYNKRAGAQKVPLPKLLFDYCLKMHPFS